MIEIFVNTSVDDAIINMKNLERHGGLTLQILKKNHDYETENDNRKSLLKAISAKIRKHLKAEKKGQN